MSARNRGLCPSNENHALDAWLVFLYGQVHAAVFIDEPFYVLGQSVDAAADFADLIIGKIVQSDAVVSADYAADGHGQTAHGSGDHRRRDDKENYHCQDAQ